MVAKIPRKFLENAQDPGDFLLIWENLAILARIRAARGAVLGNITIVICGAVSGAVERVSGRGPCVYIPGG